MRTIGMHKYRYSALALASVMLVCACGGSPRDSEPPAMVMAAAKQPARSQPSAARKVASCDGAMAGMPCGETGSQKHCVDNQCIDNACGDTVTAGVEECDDGNQRDADGCDANCRIEPPAGCGNGTTEAGEECDDGNSRDGDACTHLCRLPGCGDACERAATAGAGGAGPGRSAAGGAPAMQMAPGTASAAAGSGVPVTGDATEWATCTACRQALCSNYLGTGLDVFGGCFLSVDPILGADPTDPSFIQDCVDVVECAFRNGCAYADPEQAPAQGCYCGSSSAEQCFSEGPAADAKCVAEIQQAARSTLSAEIVRAADDEDSVTRLISFKYPLGWANFLLECDRDLCNRGSGKCTP